MDIKNINLNIKLGDLKLTEELKQKISGILFKNLRLFFIIFLGAVSIYSFNIIFKKAYVEINYIQYPVNTNALFDGKEKSMLEKITQSIEDRKNNLANLGNKQYVDPFSFRDGSSLNKAGAEDGQAGETAEVGSGTVKNGTGLTMMSQ